MSDLFALRQSNLLERHARVVGQHQQRRARLQPVAGFRTAVGLGIVLILLVALLVGQARAARAALQLSAKTASLVLDANTGKVLHSHNADASRYPASLTKMMTLFMVFEALERKHLTYKTKIRVTAAAAAKPPSKIGLRVGQTITVRDAISALVVKSANDVAAAVAIHMGGSEAEFARMMTKRAREIGMSKTRFRNASGLTDRLQRTTARDMITLALRLQDSYPVHFRNFRIRTFKWRGRTYRNTNGLLRSFYGTNGIKTGYTRASGFNLVSSVRRGRKNVVAAVFGGHSVRARNSKMRILLTRALKRASTKKTRTAKPLLIVRPSPASRPPSLSLAKRKPLPPRLPVRQRREQIAAARQTPVHEASRQPKTPPVRQTAGQPNIVISQTRRVLFRDRARTADTPRRQTALEQTTRTQPVLSGADAGPAPNSISQLIRRTLGQTFGLASAAQRDAKPIRTARASIPPAVRKPPLRLRPAPKQVRQPSTLQQQAATLDRLARGLPLQSAPSVAVPRPRLAQPRLAQPRRVQPRLAKPASPVSQPRPRQPTPLAGAQGLSIQVGAYRTPREAMARLAAIQRDYGTVVGQTAPAALPVDINGRRLYRARFVGLDLARARSTCQRLTQMGVTCLVMR